MNMQCVISHFLGNYAAGLFDRGIGCLVERFTLNFGAGTN